jgi:subtilisin family serine protease
MRTCRAALCVALCLVLAQGTLASAAGPGPHAESKVGPGVHETLAARGHADVVIALTVPAASRARSIDMTALRSEVARTQADVLATLDRSGYAGRHAYSAVPALAGRLKSAAALAALARHPSVARIDLDVGGTGSLANSVPVTGANARHLLGNTGAGVVVAVLDSGLDTDHANLADDLVAEACFLNTSGDIDGVGGCPNGSDRQVGGGAAEDDAGHGTHVTGIITSSGAAGGVGVAPDADIVAIKVTEGPSFSGVFYFFSEIVAALDYLIANPGLSVQVINMSLGTNALYAGDCDNATAGAMAGAAAINTLRANGVIAFASAGNNGSSTQMTLPACLSNVISVGAANNTDVAASFTNSNASTDIFAPGVNVLSSVLANGTGPASGTSMASPHAAGCAALLIQTGEAVTPAQIETRLETSAVTVPVAANGLSFPRIDCSPTGNRPPVCDANGPYTAQCGLLTTLDGAGSSDPESDPLSFLWSGPFVGSTAVGATPQVRFPGPLGAKSISLTVSDDQSSAQCSAQVTVEDTAPASVMCNAPATIVPPDAVISFTATATDACTGSLTPVITGYQCYKTTKKGKVVDKSDSCVVSISGDTITIRDTGGVGSGIGWTVRATDDSGNSAVASCRVDIRVP